MLPELKVSFPCNAFLAIAARSVLNGAASTGGRRDQSDNVVAVGDSISFGWPADSGKSMLEGFMFVAMENSVTAKAHV